MQRESQPPKETLEREQSSHASVAPCRQQLTSFGRRITVLGSNSHAAFTSLDPDDYELFEDAYDSDDYEEGLSELSTSMPSGTNRAMEGLLTAVRTVQIAPVETARAVQVTVEGTASMVGQVFQSCTETVKAATEESMQQLAETTKNAKVVRETRAKWEQATADLPKDPWGRVQWLWDRPPVKRLRITISMAQWTVRLPAILALIATQVGLVASQFSLPMLAPLLFGTGILLRSIRTNASLIFPRIGVVVVLLWMLWFANSVVQNTVVYLRRQGGLDHRVSGAIITASECAALLAAFVIVLSMIGVNVNALLLPAGVALAFAAKDLSHNFLAGFFLFAVQPFKLGDRVAVSYSTPSVGNRTAWFEGTCEKVDLRYTIVKNGPRRLFVPNSAFLTREFMVVDDPSNKAKRDLGADEDFGMPGSQMGDTGMWRIPYFNGRGGMEAMQQQVRVDQALQQQQHASTVSADAAGGDASGRQPAGEQLHDGSGPSVGAASSGAAPASNGSMQQPQQQQRDLSGAQHAGYYYGYDSSAPGLPQQYWGPSAYPTGYPPPGWSPSMPSR
ncbi:probable miniconductance mechanosensitive channel MscM at C-terminar half [Coccomyxa sp. Obi]|nr:probable miniconductance mechanosensitive channel MscM at C-terminar half [Coccomyxa sp. Obi]